MTEIPTKLKLAAAIREAAPGGELEAVAQAAETGFFDDFESPIATPCTALVNEFTRLGYPEMARRAMDGEWDATAAESDAWAESEDGKATFSAVAASLRGKPHNS